MRGKAFGQVASPVIQIGRASAGAGLRRVIAAFLSNTTTTAQNITAPVAGTYRLVLVGAGGSGGANSDNRGGVGAGGGSGGVVVSKAVALAAGQSIEVTLGTPGASRTGRGNPYPGNAGAGNTTATMPDGAVLSAGPGGGGNGGYSGTFAGGAGGGASGGEFNYPGNAGGTASFNTTTMVATAAAGAIESVSAGSTSITPNYGSKSAVVNPYGAAGGGNTPSGNGIIPIGVGSSGSVTQTSDPAGNLSVNVITLTGYPGAVGQGGGGAAEAGGTYVGTGAGGQAAAFLILEIS